MDTKKDTKVCYICDTEKPVHEFTKGKARCKLCISQKKKKIYNEKKQQKLDQSKDEKERLRQDFKDKHKMKPTDDMVTIPVINPSRNVYFMTEEAFERLMNDMKTHFPEEQPRAVEPPEPIKGYLQKAFKEDMPYVRAIRVIVFNTLQRLSFSPYFLF